MEIKVQILTSCATCHGEAYLPLGEAISPAGECYLRYAPCTACEGSGCQTRWISLKVLADLQVEAAITTTEPIQPELVQQPNLEAIQPILSP